jgi:hypothetical protein
MINEKELKEQISKLIQVKEALLVHECDNLAREIIILVKAHLAKYETPLPIHDLSDAD